MSDNRYADTWCGQFVILMNLWTLLAITACVQDGFMIDLFVLCVLCNANYLPATALVVIDMRTPFISYNDS